jgi:hypothetical protein
MGKFVIVSKSRITPDVRLPVKLEISVNFCHFIDSWAHFMRFLQKYSHDLQNPMYNGIEFRLFGVQSCKGDTTL